MSTMQETLIVLRFRDIGLRLGETIREHRRSIGQHGSCWWGWLYRDYERNPHADLDSLTSNYTEPFAIALYDTGQGLIYLAQCEQIITAETPIRSPDLELTPGYYRGRKAPAWFRLTEIAPSDDGAVIGRVCNALPSASPECFTDLIGKRVRSLPDLRRQEVTMWVLS